MQDQYGRVIDYLRISVTDRCNLRCVYCMPKDGVQWTTQEEILSFEEMLFVCRAAAGIGIRHIKVTGGEPLLRDGVMEFIRNLKQTEGIETVTLTTNGILLPNKIEALDKSNVDGINISLDTRSREKFRNITRGGDVERVLEGIRSVLPYQRITVKINCVPDGADWERDVVDIAGLAKEYPIHVRFIELMPLVRQKNDSGQEQEVRRLLEETYGSMKICEEKLGFGPSVYYEIDGFQGKIGFISAVSHKFCSQCNRIRLTCDGTLRMCLQSDRGVNLKQALRTGADEAQIQMLLREALTLKPKEHCFACNPIQAEAMSKIGG